MKRRRKSTQKTLYAFPVAMLMILTLSAAANYKSPRVFYKSLTAFQDTTRPVPRDTTLRNRRTTDTIPGQRVDTFSVKISKDSLTAPINYTASDSVVFDVPTKKVTLYNQSNVKYQDVDLSAYQIVLDQPSKLVIARYTRDSLGNIVGLPKFVQGENNFTADSLVYNIETQRGLTRNTNMQSGEFYVNAEASKKISANEYFALRGRFTTCNLDTPHFAFRTRKMKLVNQKIAVSGPIHPEFEDVPVPIYLPFGYFPISQGRHSGLLPPQFTASEQFGLGLEGLGYYKVLSEYFDVTLRTNIYSYGGWALYLSPTYRKRYRYSGAFNLTVQNSRILSEDPKAPFLSTKTFNITWGHTMDSKARPGTSFSASVNAGSTKFNQFVANNPTRNFTNQLNSSITYSKTWGSKYNLTLSANHQQNNNTRLITLNLPTAAFTVNTFNPFQRKEFVGDPKWYEKLGIGLNTTFVSDASFYDSLFSFAQLLDTFSWGAQHNVPIQLSLPPVGPLQIGPSISYQERWYSRRFTRTWNDAKRKVDTTIEKGFYAARDITFGLGLSTAVFGTFNRFGKNSRVQAIRHVIRPTIGINYKPDLAARDYYSQQIDTNGRTQRFSYFDGIYPGAFSEGRFGGLSFGIDNNLEMKVRSKNDTSQAAVRKVRLIDGFSINGSYNFFADSFKLSQLNMSFRSTLFEKINITGTAIFDPYEVDEFGFRRDRLMWSSGKFGLGRLVSGGLAISTSFQSKPKDPANAAQQQQDDESGLLPMTMEEQQAQLAYVRQNPAEFADFNIPWSLNFSYSLNFNKQFKSDYSGFETNVYSNVSWNGDFNLTPRWKLGMNGYYDFTTSKIQTLTMYLSREMHCWQLSINVTPVGLYRSFNITINPKS
ncbi:MAG TPA: putative LPS assembly protein LptD, partial [Chitinophagaceae bacterium]|nr:putative LPS assembly protein LptD [Chitinophagaceae bacterium]